MVPDPSRNRRGGKGEGGTSTTGLLPFSGFQSLVLFAVLYLLQFLCQGTILGSEDVKNIQ